MRIIFRVPLHAQRKARRIGNAYGLNRAVLGDSFNDDAVARLQNTLAMQGVHADRVFAKEFCKGAVRNKFDLMAVRKQEGGIGVDFAGFGSWHAMVHATPAVHGFPDGASQRRRR